MNSEYVKDLIELVCKDYNFTEDEKANILFLLDGVKEEMSDDEIIELIVSNIK